MSVIDNTTGQSLVRLLEIRSVLFFVEHVRDNMAVMLLSGRADTVMRPAQVVLRLSIDDFLTALRVKSHVSPQSDVLLLVL